MSAPLALLEEINEMALEYQEAKELHDTLLSELAIGIRLLAYHKLENHGIEMEEMVEIVHHYFDGGQEPLPLDEDIETHYSCLERLPDVRRGEK